MSDAELQRRANLYAAEAIRELRRVWGDVTYDPELITVAARAFVLGYSAGIEDATDDLRRTVKRVR